MSKESHTEIEHNPYHNLLNLYGITALQWHHYDLNQCILTIFIHFQEVEAFVCC